MKELIVSFAEKHKLPIRLIEAIIQVESGGNPWAWNPEPHYRYFWDVAHFKPFRELTQTEIVNEKPPADFPCLAGDRDQEWWAQQASWGVMQTMGAVAREHGFRGLYLTQLCESQISIEYGCIHLAAKRRRFHAQWGWDGVIAAYNAGSVRHEHGVFINQGYVDKVRKALKGAQL